MSIDLFHSTNLQMLPTSLPISDNSSPDSILDNSSAPPAAPSDSSNPAVIVFFRNHGDNNTSTTFWQKYKTLMKDENRNDQRDEYGNLLYQLGPHPDNLPGKCFHMPHPKTSFPTNMTIGKLIDDYDQTFQTNKIRQAHFKVIFTTNKKEEIMPYN